jgi:hypothetical protein
MIFSTCNLQKKSVLTYIILNFLIPNPHQVNPELYERNGELQIEEETVAKIIIGRIIHF